VLRYVIGIVVLALLFIAGLAPKLKNDRQLAAAANEAANTPPEVETVMPHLAATGGLTLPGDIQAIRETAVQARTSGYISKLYVDIGSRVKAGQVLAEIESPDVDQQVMQANADTAKSRATVGQSQSDVARLQAGVVQSYADVARQKAAILQAKAALVGSTAKRIQAEAGLSQAKAILLQNKHQVAVQTAGLSQAQAQYALAAANAKRYANLLAGGFVAQQDYDQAEATYRTTAAAIDAARASIEASKADVEAAEQSVHSNEALVRSARADEQSAAANVSAAQAGYDSVVAMLNAAKSSVQASKATVTANQAAVASSAANANRYEVLRSFEKVVAPFDGVITSRNVDEGSLVSPGNIVAASAVTSTPNVGLFGIARSDTLRIFVNLPQTDYQRARVGAKALIAVRELPKRRFEGTVAQSAGALSSDSRTLLTEVRLTNPDGVLLPGMYAEVTFPGGGQKFLRVPASTLVIDAKGTRVVVVGSDNHIHFRKVTLGRDYGTETEVLQGLQPTERLVANPTDDLQDGQTVEVGPAGGQ
jgi:RND family efflux transporter MFP subunit